VAGIVLTHTGINIGRYENLAQTVAPPDTSKAITWYADPSNPGAVMARQYVSESSPGNPYWSIAVDPAGSGPRMTLWDSNEKYLWFDNITNVVGLPGVTWFMGGIAPITAHFDVDPNTAFWLESGSEFKAWTHLLPGEDFSVTPYNIGSISQRWGTIYANNMVISGAISGATLGGAEWEYAGSMIIDANAASNTTVSIVNQNASYTASLDVEGNITLGGTVDGVGHRRTCRGRKRASRTFARHHQHLRPHGKRSHGRSCAARIRHNDIRLGAASLTLT
jgi:hypothetical protein